MSNTAARAGVFVFVAILKDRHTDDTISIHATRAGADKAVDEWISVYSYSQRNWEARDRYVWTESPPRPGAWERYVDAGDDAPKAMITLRVVGE